MDGFLGLGKQDNCEFSEEGKIGFTKDTIKLVDEEYNPFGVRKNTKFVLSNKERVSQKNNLREGILKFR